MALALLTWPLLLLPPCFLFLPPPPYLWLDALLHGSSISALPVLCLPFNIKNEQQLMCCFPAWKLFQGPFRAWLRTALSKMMVQAEGGLQYSLPIVSLPMNGKRHVYSIAIGASLLGFQLSQCMFAFVINTVCWKNLFSASQPEIGICIRHYLFIQTRVFPQTCLMQKIVGEAICMQKEHTPRGCKTFSPSAAFYPTHPPTAIWNKPSRRNRERQWWRKQQVQGSWLSSISCPLSTTNWTF